jgi:gas vesicle protein
MAQENTTAFLIVAGAIGAVAAAVLIANTAMKIYKAGVILVTAAQTAFNFVMAANPIVLVVLAIMALVAALVLAYNKSEAFRNVVNGLFDAIKTGVTASVDFIKGYLNTVLGFYKEIFNGIATLWNSTIGKLSFEVPSWVPGLGGKGFSVPKIPMLADGGIVTGPTLAMIGERGPEAVIPLNRGGIGGNITVNVYSTLADASLPDKLVNALRAYNRRSGVIDIRVA